MFKEDVVEEDDFELENEITSDKPFYMRKLEEVRTYLVIV